MLTSSQFTSTEAVNEPNFVEDVRNLSENIIFEKFLSNSDRGRFLRENPMKMRKYMGVFLYGYNNEPDFVEKYGDIFFESTNSNLQRGIFSVFFIIKRYKSTFYTEFLSRLSPVHKKEIRQFFEKSFHPETIASHFDTILQQLKTQEAYERVGLKRIK